MNTEFRVLKNIFKRRGKAPVKLISNHLGYGADYIRFICKKLKERGLVQAFSRDWYKITVKGQKELERMGLIKKSRRKKRPKMKSSVWQVVRIKETPSPRPSKIKPDFEKNREAYNPPAVQKLKIGEKIEKAAAFLQNFKKI